MAEESDANKIERLFLRLASCTSSKQLEIFSSKHLIECIEITAKNQGVRNNSVELLGHLNKRLRGNEDVKLPVHELIKKFKSSKLASNFTLIYIKMGFSRLPAKEQIELLPLLLHVSKETPQRQQNDIFGIIAPVFLEISAKKPNEWPDLGLKTDPFLRLDILSFFTDVLLLPPIDTSEDALDVVPNAMNRQGFDRVKHLHLDFDQLKCKLLHFLTSDQFSQTEILPIIIIGMTNSSHFVVSTAEMIWKKLDLHECLKNRQIIAKLFLLYSGTTNEKDVPQEEKRNPAGLNLRMKIFTALNRSEIAPLMFPQNIKVTFDALFGVENVTLGRSKLQLSATEFLRKMVEKCPQHLASTFEPILFSGAKKLIDTCESPLTISVAYLTLGEAGSRHAPLVTKDLTVLQDTFEALPSAPDQVATSVIDCLTVWLPVFADCTNDPTTVTILGALIDTYITHNSPKCRLISLKYIEILLQSCNVEFRWMLCNSYGDSRQEIRKEALRLLQKSLLSNVPTFETVVEYFEAKLFSENSRNAQIVPAKWHMVVFYCFACLTVESGREPRLDLHSDSYLEWFASVCPQIIAQSASTLALFLKMAIQALKTGADIAILDICTLFLTNKADILRFEMRAHLEWLREFLLRNSAKIDQSEAAARLYSISFDDGQIGPELDDLMARLIMKEANESVGLAWICGFFIASRAENIDKKTVSLVRNRLLELACQEKPRPLNEAACGALAESLKNDPPNGTNSDIFVRNLAEMAISRKESIKPKLKEAILAVLGFSIGLESNDALFSETIHALLAVGEGPPQVELQFNVGDALFNAAVGQCSTARRNLFCETKEHYLKKTSHLHHNSDDRFCALLTSILNDKLASSNRHLRQAALIWLFVLTEKATGWGRLAGKILDKIQQAFAEGLAEADEFSQDVASKGLGLVYELGDDEQKSTMMAILVDSLTVGRKSNRPVNQDTTIFDGSLGDAPGGSSLSTYRELCALATDLNQPDLMYKFMQLANHNALWNSKKGAAFGFGVILRQAKEQLEPHLALLVPKLYRYRYDPDVKVQSSMRTIWQTLTSSRKGVINDFADEIFAELLPSVTNNHWRVRESSCLALSDLLSGHSTPKMTNEFGGLFERLFRVQDDVKESVRLSVNRCLGTLINLTIRKCQSEKETKATEMIGVILPILIEKGVKSAVKQTRMTSLNAVISLTKEAGPFLKPHLSVLIPCLLNCLSESESSLLNYIATRSTYDQLEALDSARASAARTSPLMAAMYDCLPFVDCRVLTELGPILADQLKSAIGLSTRTGTCQFLTALCLRCQRELIESRPVCDKLLISLSHGLKDRNVTIRKQYCSTIGYLAKYSSQTLLEKLLEKVGNDYMSQQADVEIAAAFLLRGLANNNPELLKEFASQVVPLVLLIKNDYDINNKTELSEIWEEIWSEIVPGMEGCIRLYQEEIVNLSLKLLLENPIWAIKKKAAKSLKLVAEFSGKQMDSQHADRLYNSLITTLNGRTWQGKEEILKAIFTLLEKAGQQLRSIWNGSIINDKFAPLQRECDRRKSLYKAEAFYCCAIFCEQLKHSSGAFELIKKAEILLKSPEDDSDEEEKGEKSREKSEEKHNFRRILVQMLSHACVALDEATEMNSSISVFTFILSHSYWKMKQIAIISIRHLFECWPLTGPFGIDEAFLSISTVLLSCTQNTLVEDCIRTLESLFNLQNANSQVQLIVFDKEKVRNEAEKITKIDMCKKFGTFIDKCSNFV